MTRTGDARRGAIVDRAMHIASVEGIEGLTLGRLAEAVRTSKSGIQALFGTKQELQLSIVAAAARVFERDVLLPAEREPAGLARLRALMSLWIDYLETFEGGCLFVAAASELDGRSGPVRDAVADAVARADALLQRDVELAVRLRELPPGTDVEQLVFELHAMVLQANHDRQLLRREDALTRARKAVNRLLDGKQQSGDAASPSR
ncbi:TetR/AcrR family transcriptional regulator [Streptomyces gardneri]|uniref:TetR/AcrR family transcriptional regulator n=1 Tax=Nocardia TaxID=1817 RepID=UPI00135C24F2|nr:MULTISPECIES: TetR/AcrR family transcriptional regulator [Nocardia]MBF6168672.1 TetR/AcrR family transcriptional regulator [Streptomyces gardneri]MBF6208614.1 TetR/AcrR family transcriptional regulator [Streptomyces gardneri]UAK31132.1 TetR/AcrR family transcriptional regulator [Nocardia asteroides]